MDTFKQYVEGEDMVQENWRGALAAGLIGASALAGLPTDAEAAQSRPRKVISANMETSDVDLQTIVQKIMQHEGLLPKQTPFRITNPSMRKWKTIHGFVIDNTTPKPKGRENFIFLKNAEDVPKAIEAQLRRYALKPKQYGLKSTPSLEDALRVFDQSGVNGKLAFLRNAIPNLNTNMPLNSFIKEDLEIA